MIRVGDRFELPEEDVYGIVNEIVRGEYFAPVAIVVEMDDGRWAAVDLRMIEPRVLH